MAIRGINAYELKETQRIYKYLWYSLNHFASGCELSDYTIAYWPELDLLR